MTVGMWGQRGFDECGCGEGMLYVRGWVVVRL